MTEREWLAAEYPSVIVLHRSARSNRKRRLLACACAKRVLPFLPDDPRIRAVLNEAEEYAEGTGDWKRVLSARRGLRAIRSELEQNGGLEHQFHALNALVGTTADDSSGTLGALEAAVTAFAANARPDRGAGRDAERSAQLELTRDVFKNPFRPITFDPIWRTDTALSLARRMYESPAFDAMPILADALQDAGCEDEAILTHCRGDGPHVRGCWVVDLVLGKG
jgi:hypothetical protein